MRLDRQVRATGLEDREHRGHPVKVALGHYGDDVFAAEAARQQRSCELIGTAVELAVGPLPVAVHGRDGVRVCPGPLLEQLVNSAVRQLPERSGEAIELEMQFLGGEQALPLVLGIW